MHQIMARIEKLKKLTTIIHKERTLYTTICSKKYNLINIQGVRSPKIQPWVQMRKCISLYRVMLSFLYNKIILSHVISLDLG
jgi:hypothetical protein